MGAAQKSSGRSLSLTWSRRGFAFLSLLLTSAVAHGSTDIALAAVPVPPSPEDPEQASRLRLSTAESAEDRFIARGQSTYVWTRKFGFDAPYTGPQSLRTQPESSYSLSFTAYLGARLWKGGELYVNPEAFQAHPLSGLFGLAGVQNGELQKASGAELRAYGARLFLRQSFGLRGESFQVAPGLNQLATQYERRRLVVTVGKLAVIDLFEKNTYANDPRTQFMNWSLISYGAYDFAADARGYDIGGAMELYWDDWAVRIGRFMEPRVANGRSLHYNLFSTYGDQLEVEHDHEIHGKAGLVRFLIYRNLANAGRYQDAVAAAAATGSTPDITAVRGRNAKLGEGVSIEQTLSGSVGIWVRALYVNNPVEEYAFTEIDNSVSGGLSLKGSSWRRPNDTLAAAFSSNGLDGSHRDYLAAGGLGGFLGDGQLKNYGRETVVETYYSALVHSGIRLTGDYQLIANPGYNADRHGPVHLLSGRIHVEF